MYSLISIRLFAWILIISAFSSLFSNEPTETGTLIVSYHTGSKGERLNRVRFTLFSEAKGEEEMFPKGDAYVEDKEYPSRMVAVENLPIGTYRLKFLIPNADGFFEKVPERTINIKKDEVVRIDQKIRPRYASIKALAEIFPEENQTNISPTITLYDHAGQIQMQSKAGGLVAHSLSPGKYTIAFDPVVGYQTPPPIAIEVKAGRAMETFVGSYIWEGSSPSPSSSQLLSEIENLSKIAATNIIFAPRSGYFKIQADFPDGEMVTVILQPINGPPLTVRLISKDGKISWQSPSLRPGLYEITYVLPSGYKPIPSEKVVLPSGQNIQLNPELITRGSIRVISNIPDGIFFLRKDSKVWKGEGREFVFKGLPAGIYFLSFSSHDPSNFIPPNEMRLFLGDQENKLIRADYQILGKLTVMTNIPYTLVTLKELSGRRQAYQDEINDFSKTFTLPEGTYIVTLSIPPEEISKNIKLYPPDPAEIQIKGLGSESLQLDYQIENKPPLERQRRLVVTSNISDAGFTVKKFDREIQSIIGHFSGKYTQLTLPPADTYEVAFDKVPNFETPKNITIKIIPGEEKTIQASYIPIQQVVPVDAGRAIIGPATSEHDVDEGKGKIVFIDAFSVGIYEVTNAQYATWLNNALKEGKISFIEEADNRGLVVDMNDRLLFKTFEADPYSQISAQFHSSNSSAFLPLPGKDSFPVLNVSWYGAQAYCQDNYCRLPTEAEWEKAAGMALEQPKEPLKKFIYGFGKDEIDRTWANYKDNDRIIQYFQVLTTPVGFYNGENFLPLSMSTSTQQRTQLAKSPYGTFDMSGNVWEWVSDWNDEAYFKNMPDKNPKGPSNGTFKIAKGGCYDSLKEDVRVSARLALPPDHADAYTGFRIVRDEKSKEP